MNAGILRLYLLAVVIGIPAAFAQASDISSGSPAAPTAPRETESGDTPGLHIEHGTDYDIDRPRPAESGPATGSDRESPTAAYQTAQPPPSSTKRFTLIRVAPFSGIDPFDPQSLRHNLAGAGKANSCAPGSLVTMNTLVDVIPPNSAYVDVDPASKIITVRNSGTATTDTVLTATYHAPNSADFSLATTGWQAINPALPQNYSTSTRSFVVKRADSGDFYRLAVTFQTLGILQVYTVSGECCGTGGCP
jgi:hypothetical protein